MRVGQDHRGLHPGPEGKTPGTQCWGADERGQGAYGTEGGEEKSDARPFLRWSQNP